jgi:hypothetical protein
LVAKYDLVHLFLVYSVDSDNRLISVVTVLVIDPKVNLRVVCLRFCDYVDLRARSQGHDLGSIYRFVLTKANTVDISKCHIGPFGF